MSSLFFRGEDHAIMLKEEPTRKVMLLLKKFIIFKIFLSLMLTLPLSPTLAKDSAIEAKGIELRVGLSTSARSASFSSDGGLIIICGGRKIYKDGKIELTLEGSSIRIDNLKVSEKLTILPASRGLLSYNSKPYRGRFEIIPNSRGLTIVNVVNVEEYLYGVLGAEIPSSWPMEALKAQAVVSRTYAIANLGKHRANGFDLCASVHCQGYGGVSSEDPKLKRAVDETRGEILTYRGEIAKVFYHSDSGGFTLSAKSAWGEDLPYLKSLKEDFYQETSSPYSSWKLEIPSTKLMELLNDIGLDVGPPKDILITKKDEFGFRALSLKIVGSKGAVEIPATRFRQLIGFTTLRSTAFTISKKEPLERVRKANQRETQNEAPDIEKPKKRRNVNVRELLAKGLSYDEIILILAEAYGIIERDVAPKDEVSKEIIFPSKPDERVFIFEGRGWGHGVGMSQWGAKLMAERGKSYTQILEFYFPGTKIEKKR